MEPNNLYAQKYENYQKAINRQESAYVPNAMVNNGGGVFWSGKNVFDLVGNHQAFAEAMTSFLDEMWLDVQTFSILSCTPRLDAAFPTAENHLAPDGTSTHLQRPQMKADEYDQLIADPKGFIANVLLPRKFPFLYEDREAAKAALKIYAEERLDIFLTQTTCISKHIAETYGVHTCVNLNCGINTPLDHIFDSFRGFRGTLTDLRRQPEKVKAAMDAIWDYLIAAQVAGPFDPSQGFAFQPCHIPAYLSPQQYREYCWPYEKRLIEWVSSHGGKIFMLMEGRWENIWDCLLEVPKDSLVLQVDDDDFLKAHAALGDHQILCGGLKLADTRLKTFDQIKDNIKRVIDTCAPGGGFLFCADKGFLSPGDVNRTLIDCFNFAHEYSSK